MPVNTNLAAVLSKDGTHFFVLGKNNSGHLGTGDLLNRNTFTRVKLATAFSSLSPGDDNFCIGIAQDDGSLWAWGKNYYGQLGVLEGSLETLKTDLPAAQKMVNACRQFIGFPPKYTPPTLEIPSFPVPFKIPNTQNFHQVSTGNRFVLSLDSNGHVWSFGRNYAGQLGLGDTENRYQPTKIPTLTQIAAVSAGLSHGIVLDSTGNVWSFGANEFGQLGTGDIYDKHFPSKMESVKDITQVATGFDHTLLLDSFGVVRACGQNVHGECGSGDTINKLIPEIINNLEDVARVLCGGGLSIVVDVAHRVFVFGFNENDQYDLRSEERIIEPSEAESWKNKTIIPGGKHILLIDGQGSLFFYGSIVGLSIKRGKQDGVFVEPRNPLNLKRADN
jgi:alpha-tubulin suppressor-like RCC1 family protein